MKPRLAKKLAALRADLDCGEFILADAKDADMAWGAASAGPRRDAAPGGLRYRSVAEYRAQMREVVAQGLVDILLASASTMSVLAHRERLFDGSDVTPAIRANDTSDIWLPRGGRYRDAPSRPFSTCRLEEVQHCAEIPRTVAEGAPVVNLGLYSVTFNNQLDADHATLAAFRSFRIEANKCFFHYFLEVFAPNVPGAVAEGEVAGFVNDHICRMLAGVPVDRRPEFLKIPYFGPAALEELVAYDPEMIVGVLGGGSGTTYDAMKLLAEARKYGARAALFGRKIKDAEHPLEMIAGLRRVAQGETTPEEAVREYRAALERASITPLRSLAEDMELTAPELAYAR